MAEANTQRKSYKGVVNNPYKGSGKVTVKAVTKLVNGEQVRFERQSGESTEEFNIRIAQSTSRLKKAQESSREATEGLKEKYAQSKAEELNKAQTQVERERLQQQIEQVGYKVNYQDSTPVYKIKEKTSYYAEDRLTGQSRELTEGETKALTSSGESTAYYNPENKPLFSAVTYYKTGTNEKVGEASFLGVTEEKTEEKRGVIDKLFSTKKGRERYQEIQEKVKENPNYVGATGLSALNPFGEGKYDTKAIQSVKAGKSYEEYIGTQTKGVKFIARTGAVVAGGYALGATAGFIGSLSQTANVLVSAGEVGLVSKYAIDTTRKYKTAGTNKARGEIIATTAVDVLAFGVGARAGAKAVSRLGFTRKPVIDTRRTALFKSKSTKTSGVNPNKVTLAQKARKQIRINRNKYYTAEQQSVRLLRNKKPKQFNWISKSTEKYYPIGKEYNLDTGQSTITTVRTVKKPAGYDVPDVTRINPTKPGQPIKRVIIDPYGIGFKPSQRQLQLVPKNYDPLATKPSPQIADVPFYVKARADIAQTSLGNYGFKNPIPGRTKLLLTAYNRPTVGAEIPFYVKARADPNQLVFKTKTAPISLKMGKRGQLALNPLSQTRIAGGIFDNTGYNQIIVLSPQVAKSNTIPLATQPQIPGRGVFLTPLLSFGESTTQTPEITYKTNIKPIYNTQEREKVLNSTGTETILTQELQQENNLTQDSFLRGKIKVSTVTAQENIQELDVQQTQPQTKETPFSFAPQKTINPNRFVQPIPQTPPTPRKLGIPSFSTRGSSGFNVLVRKRGVFRLLPGTYSEEEALNYGRYTVGSSASASFKIQKSSDLITNRFRERGNPLDFYKKDGVFIEKRERRIKSRGELEEITFKGVFANKNKPRRQKNGKSFQFGKRGI